MFGRRLRRTPITAGGEPVPRSSRRARKPLGGDGPVVIAGGGVAALEAVLVLRERAGDEIPIELVCPQSQFVYRPLLVLAPFVENPARTVDLGRFADEHGVVLRRDRLASVKRRRRALSTEGGAVVPYRALLVALGAQALPGLEGAQSFSTLADAAALHDALKQLQPGSGSTLAFVITDRRGWVLPLYELALLSRETLDEGGASDCEIGLVTAEEHPLEILGPQATSAVEALLARNRIKVRTKADPVSFDGRAIRLKSDADVPAAHVVAQPQMRGAAIDGLRQDRNGFLRIDSHCRVRRARGVYAAGDITAGFAKQGGLAASQADVAAGTILADLGYPFDPASFEPEMQAVLLTGRLLERLREAGGPGGWTPPSKIAASRISAYLGTREPDRRRWHPRGEIPEEIELNERWL